MHDRFAHSLEVIAVIVLMLADRLAATTGHPYIRTHSFGALHEQRQPGASSVITMRDEGAPRYACRRTAGPCGWPVVARLRHRTVVA